MISDCGNVIESVKYKVWLNDDNSGIVEVAFHNQHRPKGTTKNDWTMKFDSWNGLMRRVDELRRKVRMSDPAREEVSAYCPYCNTVTIIKTKINPYRYLHVARCGNCGSCGVESCD